MSKWYCKINTDGLEKKHFSGKVSGGSEASCVDFSYSGTDYSAGKCRYDYVHSKAWCQTGPSIADWGYCQDNCNHDKGNRLISHLN